MGVHDQLFKRLFRDVFGGLLHQRRPGEALLSLVVKLRGGPNVYLKLEGDAEMRYEETMRPAANELFDENGVYWVDKLKSEAIEEGLKEGLKEGLEKGLERGRREGAVEVLLRQLERRFGPLDPAIEERVQAIESLDRLEALADRVLDAAGLEDLGLAD